MLKIAGGAYIEKCLEPAWDELVGSGGRAATALSELDDDLALWTYVGKDSVDALEILPSTFNFDINYIEIDKTLSFDYYHCLSEPKIHPPLNIIRQSPPLELKGENILRFGFLEGDAIVDGNYVVYDPQNAFEPRRFSENGSKANHLAIVANTSECIKLVADPIPWYDAEGLANALLEAENADVVVVKRGSLGSVVATKEATHEVPAWRTDRVWSIGSGDVYASVFAHYWASQKAPPLEAARLASLATATYCNSRLLPIAKTFATDNTFELISSRNDFPQESKVVYLAGPFFTIAQRWLIEEARTQLRQLGFKVFSPLHDVGYGSADEVAPADIEGLVNCDLVFGILDGLDSGTVFELGYARSLDKPVVALVQNESEENLKMISGTGCEISDDFVSSIYRTMWAAMQLLD